MRKLQIFDEFPRCKCLGVATIVLRQGHLLFAAAVLAFVMLAGCGGSMNEPAAVPLSANLRILKPGDSWQWEYSYTSAAGTTTGSATSVASIPASTLDPYLALTTTLFDTGGTPVAKAIYLKQDLPALDLYRIGNPDGLLVSPVLFLPGTWKKGLSFTTKSVGPGTAVIDTSFSIVGTETVTVPAGTYATWVVQITQDNEDIDNTSGTYWFAPQLGEYVKASFTTTYDFGHPEPLVYSHVYQLTKTNIVN